MTDPSLEPTQDALENQPPIQPVNAFNTQTPPSTTTIQTVEPLQTQQPIDSQSFNMNSSGFDKKKLIIIISTIVGLILLGITGWLVYKKLIITKNSNPITNSSTPSIKHDFKTITFEGSGDFISEEFSIPGKTIIRYELTAIGPKDSYPSANLVPLEYFKPEEYPGFGLSVSGGSRGSDLLLPSFLDTPSPFVVKVVANPSVKWKVTVDDPFSKKSKEFPTTGLVGENFIVSDPVTLNPDIKSITINSPGKCTGSCSFKVEFLDENGYVGEEIDESMTLNDSKQIELELDKKITNHKKPLVLQIRPFTNGPWTVNLQ